MSIDACLELSQRALPPQRLVRLLRPPGALTVLAAPDGFGKTTLLRWWAKHWPAPVLWVAGPAEEEAPTGEIAAAVLASIARSARLAASPAIGAVDDVLGVAQTLSRAIPVGRHVSVVIDDATPAVLRFAVDLSAVLGALRRREISVIVAGRLPSVPPAVSPRSSRPLWLGPDALRLRISEMRRSLERLLGRAPSAAEAEEVATITDGWPAGLLMGAAILKADRMDLLRGVARSEYVLGRATQIAWSREQPAA